MNPTSAAPFFTLTALVHLMACASRFPDVASELPDYTEVWVAFLHGPLLLLGGYFEGQLDYGANPVSLPRWMTITSRPVKWSFTFAFIYLSLVALAVWDVSIRGLRPVAPLDWPVRPRVLFFIAMTAGMAFAYYLHASKLLIPLVRGLSWPARKLPRPLGLPLALVLGGGLGLILVHWVERTWVGDPAGAVDALLQAPAAVVVAGLGGIAALAVLGATFLSRPR